MKLTNSERGYYASLMNLIDNNNTGKVKGRRAIEFFKTSGLHSETLKKIW